MKSHTRTRVEPMAEEAGKGQIRQINEARILSAAERVFAGAGFGGATMAAIADQAALPKANLHYYFGAKRDLYRAVLAQTLQDWLEPTHVIVPEADPKTAIEAYIRAKMALSIARPHASRVFANELLHGAPMIKSLLITDLRQLVLSKSDVIGQWIDAGKMAPVNPVHLFFTIWAATQTYADFEVQVCAVLGQTELNRAEQDRATEHVVSLILRGCGFS
ncbi:MAG: TetR family transcriptional regulator C-terminal domain-containing protein [Rhodoferax sp.]|uniref:TetR/AcrR family transcriptional regulator n=1 Tax=Rhodoferax sp. TaxID=50421 RepID=UPI001B6E70D1|nr:TetR/AcrR family transcriptional regulator [Rhodoferax sp.]MBP8287054.1 TetR family transcriptional regulator C-terminal domain-containing protein [Rhodoferax sp.]MBP9148738.1 TetR family transcriptional regulator C-terminal domain-containing protein [Rhodoferax sp.]MBP9737096.1 TetR family transcriptional regulator C-terminal domain-containing protein [Rhodoferax sp.]